MPLRNPTFWTERAETGGPCWSGDRWLDAEHAVVVRHALRRLMPRDAVLVLDVGCGDGRWTAWIGRQFDCTVSGVDGLHWPGVEARIPFVVADAETLHEDPHVAMMLRGHQPDLIVSLNAITCVVDWRAAVRAMCRVAPRVLMFDNFQTPTPPWWTNLPHRQPITWPELVGAFDEQGFTVERVVGADLFHRRLFLTTPRWLHPAVAGVSALADLTAAHLLPFHACRQMGFLFREW